MANLALEAYADAIRETRQMARKIEKSPGESMQDIEVRLEMDVQAEGKKGVKVGGKIYSPALPVGGVSVGGEASGGYSLDVVNEAIAKIVITHRIRMSEEGAAKP